MTELKDLGMFEFPNDICNELNGTRWHAWLSPRAPAADRQGQHRLKYADWLKDKELQQKGVYIWTQEVGSNLLRFIHVGVSERGNSKLATRTQNHLRRQLSVSCVTRDRIHQLADGIDEFGVLGRDLRYCGNWESAAKNFIEKLRIIYLLPTEDRSLKAIRNLEGVLAYSASYLLDTTDRNGDNGWETTNTLAKTTKWKADLVSAALVSDWLRELSHCQVLPHAPRRRSRTATVSTSI